MIRSPSKHFAKMKNVIDLKELIAGCLYVPLSLLAIESKKNRIAEWVDYLSFKTHSTGSNFGWSERDYCEVGLSKFHGHQSQLER